MHVKLSHCVRISNYKSKEQAGASALKETGDGESNHIWATAAINKAM